MAPTTAEKALASAMSHLGVSKSMQQGVQQSLQHVFAAPDNSSAADVSTRTRTGSQMHAPYVDWRRDIPTNDPRDSVPDFSFAGYRGNTAPIPINRPTTVTVHPTGRDQTDELQRLLDQGHMIQLAPGRYVLDSEEKLTLTVSGSGLRGAGPNQTLIECRGPIRTCIRVGRWDPGTMTVAKQRRSMIADDYVPVGARELRVRDSSKFEVGMLVTIQKLASAKWIAAQGMDKLERNGARQTWLKVDTALHSERRIVAINDDALVFDIPLVDSIDAKLDVKGFVAPVTMPEQASELGIESLTLRLWENHASDSIKGETWKPIRISKFVTDSWVANVVCENFLSGIGTEVDSRRITIQDCIFVRRGGGDGSAGWPSDFNFEGTESLLLRCRSDSPASYKGFHHTTQARHTGPNALVQCIAPNARIAPHQRWNTGLLVDVCQAQGIQFMNRGTMGSGHGWPIGTALAWNCECDELVVQSPPHSSNWAIGTVGKTVKSTQYKLHHGSHVAPWSLFATQLEQRLGADAVRDVLGYVGPSAGR